MKYAEYFKLNICGTPGDAAVTVQEMVRRICNICDGHPPE